MERSSSGKQVDRGKKVDDGAERRLRDEILEETKTTVDVAKGSRRIRIYLSSEPIAKLFVRFESETKLRFINFDLIAKQTVK